jgi:hypothetical protein
MNRLKSSIKRQILSYMVEKEKTHAFYMIPFNIKLSLWCGLGLDPPKVMLKFDS